MKIQLNYLNPDKEKQDNDKDVVSATWHSRQKTYESEQMDKDMVESPVGQRVDRVILNDIQMTSKSQVDDLIKFLDNLKPSLKY